MEDTDLSGSAGRSSSQKRKSGKADGFGFLPMEAKYRFSMKQLKEEREQITGTKEET